MSTVFQWNGHDIEIRCRPAAKFLWTATETHVTVDGNEIGHSGGYRLVERIVGSFPHNQYYSKLMLEMKVDLVTLASIPYTLTIDGAVISQGRLKIIDWALVLIPTSVLLSTACCCAAIPVALLAIGNLAK